MGAGGEKGKAWDRGEEVSKGERKRKEMSERVDGGRKKGERRGEEGKWAERGEEVSQGERRGLGGQLGKE